VRPSAQRASNNRRAASAAPPSRGSLAAATEDDVPRERLAAKVTPPRRIWPSRLGRRATKRPRDRFIG